MGIRKPKNKAKKEETERGVTANMHAQACLAQVRKKYLLARHKIIDSFSELLEIKLRFILEAGTLEGVKETCQ